MKLSIPVRALALVFGLALFPSYSAASADTGELEESILALVNGEPITLTDLEQHLGRIHGEAGADQRSGIDLEKMMNRLTNDLLLAQEARALEMEQEPPTSDQLRRYRKKMLLSILEKEAVDDLADPSDSEIQALYQDQYSRVTFRIITRYERAEAEQTLKALAGGADMTTLAKESSVDPYALRGGLVEEINRIDLQREVAEQAFQAAIGEPVGPVRTDLGWSVIRVEAIQEADPERFEARKPGLVRLIRQQKSALLRAGLAREAMKNNSVTVYKEVVDSLQPERQPDGRLFPTIQDDSAVVATIGESRTITADRYGKELLSRWTGVRNEDAARAAAPIILQKILQEELMLAEAEQRGLANRPSVQARLRSMETELLVPRYLEEVMAAGITVTPEEMQEHYAANKEHLNKPPRVRLSQITVTEHEEAERIAGLLREGTDTAWLARQHSIDRFREKGGDRGWVTVTVGANTEYHRLLETQIGDVLDPVGIPGNWVVTKVTNREEQGVYPFEAIAGNMRQAVFDRKVVEYMDLFITKLRGRAEIIMNEKAITRLTVQGEQEAAVEQGGEHGDHAH